MKNRHNKIKREKIYFNKTDVCKTKTLSGVCVCACALWQSVNEIVCKMHLSTGRLTHRLTDWQIQKMNEWLYEWVHDDDNDDAGWVLGHLAQFTCLADDGTEWKPSRARTQIMRIKWKLGKAPHSQSFSTLNGPSSPPASSSLCYVSIYLAFSIWAIHSNILIFSCKALVLFLLGE